MLSFSHNKQLVVTIFLTITTHLIYKILTIHGTIIGNKILFKF